MEIEYFDTRSYSYILLELPNIIIFHMYVDHCAACIHQWTFE
jgi:hypothetical protein